MGNAVTTDESGYNTNVVLQRKHPSIESREYERTMQEQREINEAALKIQSIFRGFMARNNN
jgi:hypothetical protein